MSQILVTKESIQKMLDNPNRLYVMNVIGRALVAIWNRQTEDEKSTNETKIHNGIGFAGCDARSGSLTARSYLKNKRLEDWQMDRWMKKSEKSGYARLCKYHTQLNQIALSKQK